jgi:hypothetical protein
VQFTQHRDQAVVGLAVGAAPPAWRVERAGNAQLRVVDEPCGARLAPKDGEAYDGPCCAVDIVQGPRIVRLGALSSSVPYDSSLGAAAELDLFLQLREAGHKVALCHTPAVAARPQPGQGDSKVWPDVPTAGSISALLEKHKLVRFATGCSRAGRA